MEEYSMILRNYLYSIDYYYEQMYMNNNLGKSFKDDMEVVYYYLFSNENSYFNNYIINITGFEIDDIEIKNVPVLKNMLKMILLTDYYIKLRNEETMGTIKTKNFGVRSALESTLNTEKYDEFLINFHYISEVINSSFNMLHASNFERANLMNTLYDEDIDILMQFNPLFKDEYKKYKVTDYETFLISEMTFMKKNKNTNRHILELATSFLLNSLISDDEGIKDLIDKLISYIDNEELFINAISEENIKITGPVLLSFYNDNYEKIKKL